MAQLLFANQREANLQSTVALVEEVLEELGHVPSKSRIDDPTALHAWRIETGSAVTKVALTAHAEFTHVRMWAIVMTLDSNVDRAALFSHLLALNSQLCGAAFATEGDRVLLATERSTLDLDRSEILDPVRRVTTYADQYDDMLVARFGGRLGE